MRRYSADLLFSKKRLVFKSRGQNLAHPSNTTNLSEAPTINQRNMKLTLPNGNMTTRASEGYRVLQINVDNTILMT